MALPKTLKNFTAFIDGVGYVGLVEEGTPPKVTLKTEEFAGGGMIGTVDISSGAVNKITFDITLAEFNPAAMNVFGKPDTPISFRGAQGSANEAVIYETRSLITEMDPGSWKAQAKGTLKFTATASYLKITVAGSVVLEIDVENMVFRAGGVDQVASMRSALGI